MVSSEVFRSSPLRDTRHQPFQVESSSPDLPPLHDVLSQKTNQPSVQGRGIAAPILVDTPPSFVSARYLHASTEQTPGAASAPLDELVTNVPKPSVPADSAAEISGHGVFMTAEPALAEQREEDIVVVKITGKGSRKPRQQKVAKPATINRTKTKSATKKLQGSNDGMTDKDSSLADNDDGNNIQENQAKPKAPKSRKKTGTMSHHFPLADKPEISGKSKEKQKDVNEPLHLEQAPARRRDWTPPAQKTILNIDSDSSTFKQLASSEADKPLPVFKDLVEGYACLEEPLELTPQTLMSASDEDSIFLKKRKRIELLAAKGTNPIVAVPVKSPKKAPKKKRPRTITELATAAYRVPSQPDPEPPTASILDHLQTTGDKVSSAADEQPKNKGKGNQRRKASKPPKKKAPPKPVLLSPGTALAQVAHQDFVFGTSSQLAREESPTVLRDLQAALRQSNQNDDMDLAIDINSDAVESLRQRNSLWNAAARDTEGDLFNVEVINLTEDTTLLEDGSHADPFGYHIGEDQPIVPAEEYVLDDQDPFLDLPDAMPSPRGRAAQDVNSGSPSFSDSELSTSTNIQRSIPGTIGVGQENLAPLTKVLEKKSDLPQAPQPDYEGYTDIRLAREIRKFGFKPIKRRSAMIALLNQCWQSKARIGQVGLHTSTKSPPASKPAKKAASTSAEGVSKKPRGRPRKTRPSASEPQEPPPSAQPPETPKRPVGRPRKDSASSLPSIVSPSRPNAASLSKQTSTSPRRRRAAKKPVIEIPDSEDMESDFSSSPDSVAEQMFSSPPPLDLSLSTNDGTEPTLTAAQSDEDAALFEHITRAVRSARRTSDPQQPSWHEKILLYDPIVLEDLAAWLNTGELGRVGYDEEVSPNDVKKWCESKSICCLWRVNLRGKERKRF
ncbi:hypothetical protein F66182_784 [Fusarium sp. NRRL 66182]|nr:hypothetical protein F66182_784 [Fusarium sp. NRRL 66182]